jgi:4-carboxymuconolactone decarboxylase
MTAPEASAPILRALDDATRALIRLSATITTGSELEIRNAIVEFSGHIPAGWVDELILQSYLFAGFPRALNAMREWRRVAPEPVRRAVDQDLVMWRSEGQETCAAVYGAMYGRLRENIRALHPALDEWMITEGYGKVLSRPGLDLPRRELCIVAACAAAGQDRQLHSHLHGALNVGVSPAAIGDAVEVIAALVGGDRAQSLRLLWARVRGK